jgi:hypothetical protein
VGYLKGLEKEQRDLYAAHGESTEITCPQLEKALKASPGAKTCAVLGGEAESRLLDLAKLIQATADWRDPMQKELADATLRLDLGLSLIQESQQAIDAWALAYGQLASAVANGGRIDPAVLAESVVTINQLVRRMREL